MNLPLVSVIIPVFNQEQFLSEALESVLAQTYANFEAIIVDDGSTDTSPQICKHYQKKDPRIHPIFESNKGPSSARNEAILRARGEYVCLLDSDDLMDRRRIESQIKPFLKDSSIDVVYTSVLLIDDHGTILGEIKGESLSPELFHAEMFFRNLIPGPGIMAKRACFLHESYNPQFVHAEDYELMLRFLKHYRFFYLNEPLTLYRRHGRNLSENRNAHRAGEMRALKLYKRETIEKVVYAAPLSQDAASLLLGKILFNKELFQESLDILKKTASALSLFYQGNCYYKLGQFEAAKHCFEKSLELDPFSNPACYNNLAVLFIKDHNKERAKKALQKALELKKEYLDASYNLSSLITDETLSPKFTLKELRTYLIPYCSMG